MEKKVNNQQAKILLDLAQFELPSTIFDVLEINYSVIDKYGNYLSQNNQTIKSISQGLLNAEEIDPITWNDCKRVMQSGIKEIKEEYFKGRNYLSIKKPIIEQANCLGIMVISIDITKEKQAEEAKKQFLSNMQHDLRTPFSGIMGIADLLYHQEQDAEKKELMGLMVKSCSQWETVHHRIFDALSIDNGVTKETFCLLDELISIKDMMLATLHIKKLNLILENVSPREVESLIITTDRLKLQLILLSLISNAINFTETGWVKVRVKLTSHQLMIAIEDTGIGIPEDKLEYIFERFTKLAASNDYGSDFKGVGLGLYICQQYAESLGGKITVVSQVGQGSTFTLMLPLSSTKEQNQ